MQGGEIKCMSLSQWCKMRLLAAEPSCYKTNMFSILGVGVVFTLLTFPLRCTLDIEQCGRGRLFSGPFANEAIKWILPWLSEGQGRHGESSAVSANTTRLSLPAVRIHNRPGFVGAATRSVWSPLVSVTFSRAGDHRQHQVTFIRVRPAVVNGNEIKRLR